MPNIPRDHDEVHNECDKHHDSPRCITHVVAFLFSFLYECCDVDHDDDEEEAHENRAADEKRDVTPPVRWLCSSHVAWHCYKSDKQQHSEYKSCDVSRGDRCDVIDVHVRATRAMRRALR